MSVSSQGADERLAPCNADESFNGSFRDECLNLNWFASMAEARATIEAWRRDDNESRPHMALNSLSPAEFAHTTGSREEGSVQMAVGF